MVRTPRILMCEPEYYGIEYEINPWMNRQVRSDPDESRRQWWRLHEILRDLGVTIADGPDPDAAERAFQSIPPMAVTFATMKADCDDAQGDGHWRTYLGLFFDRAVAPVGYAVDDFAAVTAPTLILAGDRDMFCTVEAACAAYRTLPAGELGIVPGTGHEITTQIIDAMTAFLIRHSPTA